MLILVRKAQQGIWIEGDKGDIWVRVLSVERDRVKLGIEAPGDVKVMRQELLADEGGQPVVDGVGSARSHNAPPAEDARTQGAP